MHLPAFILTGVVIKKLFNWQRYRAIAFLLVALLAFAMHALLDQFARFVYSPMPDFNNPAWIALEVVVLLASVVFVYMYWGQAKWGIIFAVLPCIDWLFIDVQQLSGFRLPFYNTPYIHNAIHSVLDNIPPFTYLSQTQNLSNNPLAAFIELAIILLLLWVIYLQDNRRRNIHF